MKDQKQSSCRSNDQVETQRLELHPRSTRVNPGQPGTWGSQSRSRRRMTQLTAPRVRTFDTARRSLSGVISSRHVFPPPRTRAAPHRRSGGGGGVEPPPPGPSPRGCAARCVSEPRRPCWTHFSLRHHVDPVPSHGERRPQCASLYVTLRSFASHRSTVNSTITLAQTVNIF